jgi:predicted Zn-dependent protease
MLALLCVPLFFGLSGCRKVQGTGRTQLVLTPESLENELGLEAYREIIKKEKPSSDQEMTAIVKRVGERLAKVAPARDFEWEFRLLESPQANAFALPGGKTAVYTGILSCCQNEAGLAAVMGHEIGHAIARHGGERMTQGVLLQGVSTGLSTYLQQSGVPATQSNIALAAFGAGAQLGLVLPYSRSHELEADYLGLKYMAKAGYDPNEAVTFWNRFAGKGGGAPNFLSTHPASADRAQQLNEKLQEAQKLYAKSPRYGSGERLPERYLKPSAIGGK